MKPKSAPLPHLLLLALSTFLALLPWTAHAQSLINVDFGAGATSAKVGFAATGQATNDFWNRYSHYEPRFTPGMALVADGRLAGLKYADGSTSRVAIAVTNAPGVWGNATGDAMFDSYIFAPNGSNIVITLTGLDPGRYHFFVYGYAAADVSPEQNPLFSLHSGTNQLGPLTASGAAGWRVPQPWQERAQFLQFRDVPVQSNQQFTIVAAPVAGGIAVLNGLQILSRGTGPPRFETLDKGPTVAGPTNLLFREIHYDGKLDASSARFLVTLEVDSRNTNELSALLFEGDVALLAPKLPAGWRIVNQSNQFFLHAAAPGSHRLEFELAAKIQRAEPWNQISLLGPPAAIATLAVQTGGRDVEVQLLSGTPVESGSADKENVRAVLGADRQLALRWQSKTIEVARDAVVTVDSRMTAHFTPAAIRYTSQLRYEVLQSRLGQVKLTLPTDHALTKVEGDAMRDWSIETVDDRQLLTVDFIRPTENAAKLTLTSEQALASLPALVDLRLPQPLNVQRETGALSLTAEDVDARIESTTGLRQVNATQNELSAYRFSLRPAALRAQVMRVEPLMTVAARVHTRLDESRLLIRHDLDLNVARAGIYTLELRPQPGLIVGEVQGAGVDDWKLADGKLRLSFDRRVVGDRKLAVQLERALTNTPPEVILLPLTVTGAPMQTVFIGAGSSLGIQLKTASLEGVREIPATQLPGHKDELLAFRGDNGTWRVVLAAERLSPRIVGEVFNLVTIGEGLVGGSATIRFGIVNQGVQQFRVRLPKHWRNIEFTGPNIRRKDQQDDVWTITLQDKAWAGYTLVITYDHAFDPKKASLDAAGAHPLDVERETGTLAITSAANLTVEPAPVSEPLRQIDPTELADTDRSLIARPVLLAYRYEGTNYSHRLSLARHDELTVLDAAADRAQLTTILTESGEMLTQASFMVKNNERQFQRFQLPQGATLWGVTVNGEPVKADRDADALLVSLPRGANRDQAVAVDLKYAQKLGSLGRLFPSRLELVAPKTDVPGTYAEWQLYLPSSKHVSAFGGNMTVTRGTTYGFRDARNEFVRVYRGLWHEYGPGLIFGGGLFAFVIALVVYGRKRGFSGVVGVIGLFCVLAILAGMLLPALAKSKAKAQRIKSISNLKNIGLAARIFATDNNGRMPASFEEMMTELSTDKILFDPETGERYTYAGAGKSENDPHAIIAYSTEKSGRREVVLADGSVQIMNARQFADASAKETRANPIALDPQLAQRYGLAPATPPPSAPADVSAAAASRPPAAAPQSGPVARAASGGAVVAGGPVASPVVTGIKSLRIEIPKSGRPFNFTRVLNLSGEPPAIHVSLMSGRVFMLWKTFFQLTAFLAGLGMAWIQWRRERPKTFWLALGAVLALVATADLFVAWRMLHLALIVSVPGFSLILMAWLLWRIFRRRGEDPSSASSRPIAPATALLILSLAAPRLVAAAGVNSSNSVSIVAASYTGTAYERVAQLDATLDFVCNSTNQMVALFGKEAAIQEFAATAGDARIWREGGTVGVLLPAPGTASVKFKLLVRLGGDVSRRQLDLAIPPALSSRLALTLDEPDADVEFPDAIMFTRTVQNQKTVVEAILGATDRLALSWTPRLKRAADVAATAFVQNASLLSCGGGVVNTRTVLSWQVSQGELRSLRIALPQGRRLLKVSGEFVRSWDFADADRTVLRIELLKPVSPIARIIVETEAPLDQLPADVPVLLPHALEVKRETGHVAVRADDELGLSVQRSAGLERVDNTEFGRVFGDDKLAVFSAWRFLRPGFELVLRAEALQPKLEAAVHNHFFVEVEQLRIASHADYSITRAGIFALGLALPLEPRIESVACAAMQGWSEESEAGARFLVVALKQRTLGKVEVAIRLAQAFTNLPSTLDLAGVHPLGADKLTGFVSVSAEPGVGVRTSAMTGLSEIPASSLPGLAPSASGVLGFKYLVTEQYAVAPWRLALATERLESWVRAEVASFVSLSETLLTGRALVRYEIQNAPVKEFRLNVPAVWRNVEIAGTGIRRRDQTAGTTHHEWRVELQSKVRGEYRLTVHWEQPRTGTNDLVLNGVEALGVERETGALALFAQSQLQITPKETSEPLLRIDARELPEWAADRPPGSPVLSYRYLRPGWRLALDARRFEEAALLQALVDSVRLRTVVADDGQFMTQMELSVRNNGRQNLALALPREARVWSAFVDGQPVRPAKRGDRLLLPLERTGSGDALIPIEVTYVGAGKFPRSGGKVELVSPHLDVPLKEARWEVFLPPDYTYEAFKGSMRYESADLVPVAQEFTSAEYQRQESASQEDSAAKAMDLLKRAKSEIASGQYENAGKLSRFQGRALGDEAAAIELKTLEKDLSRVQSSNLIRAQQNYTIENTVRLGGETPTAQMKANQGPADYDAKVAEQQVAQLQKAQAVAVARVTPLRVNLPTRGLRHSFVQVLQTEVDKPLTIRFHATSDREMGWFKTGVLGLSGFLAVWLAAAVASFSRRNSRPENAESMSQ